MSWLRAPCTDKNNYFDTAWGLHLTVDAEDSRDKTQAIFGASDTEMQNHLPDSLIKALFGENRKVVTICNNGTTAVQMALSFASSPATIRLIGIGSYAGAYAFSECSSSTPVDIHNFTKRNTWELE